MSVHAFFRALSLASALLVLATGLPAQGATDPGRATARLRQEVGPGLQVRLRRGTETSAFVSAPRGGDLSPRAAGRLDPGARAAAFLSVNGDLFGLTDPSQQLRAIGLTSDRLGMSHVAFEQRQEGVPVFGGELRAHISADGRLVSVAGATVPIDGPLSSEPKLPAAEAASLASKGFLEVIAQRLVFYPTQLVRGRRGETRLAWEIEVADEEGRAAALVLIDALTGAELDRFSLVHDTIRRIVFEGSTSNEVWDDADGHPDPIPTGWASGTTDQIVGWQDLIDGARETYNLIGSMTGGSYLSHRGDDASMYGLHAPTGGNCPNAYYSSSLTSYCEGVTSDDVVGHEWIHGYTSFTHRLIYAYQPGALNESYSDIFGEAVDLLNGRGTDTPNTPRSADGAGCSLYGRGSPKTDDSYRWLIGEDSWAFGSPIRDMWYPECAGDPGRVGSSKYWCFSGDNGGVHINSGIPNRAFSFLVDGGTFNGTTISGIGIEKALHIYWRAAAIYQTSVSEFPDHADALEASCSDLIGAPLPQPVVTDPATWTGTLSSTIDAGDCAEVAAAIAATELREEPQGCGFEPLLDPATPETCSGNPEEVVFFEDFESGLGTWTVGTRAVAKPSTFDTPDWEVVSSLPDGRTGKAAFVIDDPALGDCALDDESGVLYLQSPSIVAPNTSAALRLSFDHWHATETAWDGGNVKIRVNGGPWTLIGSDAFTHNAYNRVLNTSNTNPMAGEAAFSGTDEGSTGGSWGRSLLSLANYVAPGDSFELRFEMGIDGCNGRVGWYVDDVRLFNCPTEAVCPSSPEAGCRQGGARSSSLILGAPSKPKFVWRMARGDETRTEDFLDPSRTGGNVGVCLYDDSGTGAPIYQANFETGLNCHGKDCWKPISTRGYKYKSKDGGDSSGVTNLLLKSGEQGKSLVLAKGKGAHLSLPTLPLTPPIRAQLIIDDGVERNCWESSLSIVLKNDETGFKGRNP
jgi:Zn-dependent metalloprotease